MGSRPPNKKPSGGRPIRRLFSKDSLSSLASWTSESIAHSREPSSERGDEPRSRIVTQQPSLATLGETLDEADEKKPWLEKDFVSSPIPNKQEHLVFDDTLGSGSAHLTKSSMSLLSSKMSPVGQSKMSEGLATSRSSTSSSLPPVSPSRARWDQLRHHVLPSSSSNVQSPDPSFTNFSQLSLPGLGPAIAPAPLRPSRFAARFGFRQVVTEAREAADDLTRKFSDDIQRACWSVRFGDIRPSKPEREATQPSLGSTLHLPFMSSASLPLSGNMSTNNLTMPSSSRHGLRGAMSTMNLNSQPTSRMNALADLQGEIIRYASVSTQKEMVYGYLPHEKEVLSVLLVAFLSQSTGHIAEDERRLSLEIFETIVQSWKAPQAEDEIERCLWCCKAATMPSNPLRSRVLLSLNSILAIHGSFLTSPISYRTILPSLALLVSRLSGSHDGNANDMAYVQEIISKIVSGSCGRLDLDDLEQKYQALAVKADTDDDLRQGVCVEALVSCLDFGVPEQKRSLLRVVEKYWNLPDPSATSTPLRSKVHLNKITSFLRSVLNILHESLKATGTSFLGPADFKLITQILTTRVLPELDILGSSDDSTRDTRSLNVKVALTLIGAEADSDSEDVDTFADPKQSQATQMVFGWLGGASLSWRECVQRELKNFATSSEWSIVIHVAYNLVSLLPENSRKTVVGIMIPQFQERMILDVPPYPNEPLTRLLTSFAAVCPQIFYKPLFLCAASAKNETVAHQLAILVALGHYMPNFWTADAEMVSVALMSDPTSGAGLGKGKAKEGLPPVWGKSRLGQTIVLLELIEQLRSIRVEHSANQDATMVSNTSIAKVVKFASILENRLAILIDAKEQTVLLPLSQRILFSALFLEIRLITRTLKSTAWLPRIISWTTHHSVDPEAYVPPINKELTDEVGETWDKLKMVYTISKASLKHTNQRRNTVILSSNLENSISESFHDSRELLIDLRLKLLESLPTDPLCTLLETLVALCAALTHEDLVRLGPLVWDLCMNINETKAVIHACFICMQCAEKAQDKFLSFLSARLQSPTTAVRKETVHRLSILSGWRFQLLSLTYITDRTHRRPFKLARPQLTFVATDVGKSKFIPDDDYEEAAGGQGHVLPLDLRRRLNEIGWDEEDKPMDLHLQWMRTPMSLLSGNQLDQISTSSTAVDEGQLSDRSPSSAASPSSTPSKSPSGSERGVVRRDSLSGGQHNGKRRPVFVQPLVAIFLPLSKLAIDNDFVVASLARELLVDYMRDDPSVLCRAVVDILSEDVGAIDRAITTLRSFLHLRTVLPPRLTHHAFNHLAGFLKFLAKDPSAPDSLRDLAYTVPVLAKFAPQVSDMSLRAIRRAKIEVFLFPSGMLYFPESTPLGPMFPKGPDTVASPFDDCPPTLVYMTMIRMSQNLLFVEMLKRNPQDVHIVRKSWTPLDLPDLLDVGDVGGVVPQRLMKKSIPEQGMASFRLSLSFSRSHLLFVAQMFRCLTRHLNDRAELSNFLDGVNRILLRHSDDIGIVSHALIVYMIASTRFRRLMSSGTGFMLILPALFKAYCEAEGDAGIREAIEYAVHRFFAVHEEVFVYQTLQVVSGLVTHPSADGDWIASNVFHLLSTLKSNPSAQDAAGIRDANKAQEEETALAITADERPQVFLASLRKDSGMAGTEKLQSSLSVEIFDSKRFQPDNIIRMLLTVIAHDPTVRRAEQFLRLFRFLVPYLYNASNSARTVLRDGVDALGAIITSKVAAKAKVPESAQIKPAWRDYGEEADAHPSNKFGNPTSPCDLQAMRSDYLLLFASYVKAGGAHRVSSLQRSLDLAKLILKESFTSSAALNSVRLFFDRIAETLLLREDPKYSISLLKEFAPIISAHGSVLDLTGLLQSLVTLSSIPNFANDPKFSDVVVTQICSSALEICELAAHENILSTLKFRPALIVLLVRSVCLLGPDIIAELEKRDPSPAFLSGIVLPFIFQLRTTAELATDTQWTDSWRQDAHARAWVRLLSYAMTAFQNQPSTSLKSSRGIHKRSPSFTGPGAEPTVEPEEGTSRLTKKARRRPSGQNSIITSVRLAMAFVILKAVVLRGDDDISSVFPGAWARVGTLLRFMLRDGSAMFALRDQLTSAVPSPLPSPIASTSFSELIDNATEKKHKRSSSSTSDARLSAPYPNLERRPSRPSSPSNPSSHRNSLQQFPCPRLVDYLAWSLLEFTCLRRSPLTIQLRMFIHEKTLHLNDVLQTSDPISGNASFVGSARTRKGLRPISTVFSRPRYRASSAATTPEGSPFLGPSDLNMSFAGNLSSISSISSLARGDFGTSTPLCPKGRRPIIHLGVNAPPTNSFLSPLFVPASTSTNSNLSRSQSGEDVGRADIVSDARHALSRTTLRSPGLVQRTYERVRVVQKCVGYSAFLPIPETLAKPVVTETMGSAGDRTYTYEFASGRRGSFFTSASPRASAILDPDAEAEPEVRVWTKRRAAEQLMAEAQDLLRAWQVESAITVPGSDTGHGDEMLSAAMSAEEDFDITLVTAVEGNV